MQRDVSFAAVCMILWFPLYRCDPEAVLVALDANARCLICPVVCGTGVSMNMVVGYPTNNWHSIMGMTQDQCQGGRSLFSWCHKVVAIPGEHLEAAVIAS